jgi:hypothetical protein
MLGAVLLYATAQSVIMLIIILLNVVGPYGDSTARESLLKGKVQYN